MSNILKLLLIVLFIEITFESKVSTIQKNSLKKEIKKLDALVKKQNKPLETINITKSFIKCLNKTRIIPNKLLRAISSQSSITVTKDYEYIFAPYYNVTIRQKMNNQIRECSNENNVNKKSFGERNNRAGASKPSVVISGYNHCKLNDTAECINKEKIISEAKLISSIGNTNNNKKHLEKIQNTINILLSQFESNSEQYSKIKNCICTSKCYELFFN